MGDVFEFAGVVGVVLIAALGWRWGTLWIHRLRGEAAAEIEALEERVSELERALEGRGAVRRIEGTPVESDTPEP